MPLSTSKLEKLLSLKGFVPSRYFVMHSIIVYMEIVSILTADTFLLYIPSKYKFVIKNGDSVYKVKYIDIDETDYNTADNYAGEQDENTVENTYKEIDLNIIPTVQGDNIALNLEENYKHIISLKDIYNGDMKELKDICRQLKRIRFCVQNVKYKIAIMYKNYICSIKRDESIEVFSIEKFIGKDCTKLYVTVDLELLYEKMESLLLNISTIRKGLYHILDKNHFKHTRTLQKLLEEKRDIIDFSEGVYTKKIMYEKHLNESNNMLDIINKSEKNLLYKIHESNEKYNNNNGLKSLSSDIEHSHKLSNLNKELLDIQKIKEDIVKTIFELKTKKDNMVLKVDKIMFDNNVMVECVLRNFSELGKLCR